MKSDDLEVYTKLCAHNCMMYLFSKHVLKMYLYMDKGEDGGKWIWWQVKWCDKGGHNKL